MNFLLVSFIFFCCGFVSNAQPVNLKLELLQVIFRHGDRVPLKSEIYPADPYNYLYKKLGYGQLTKLGMEREFKIGQMLREQYNPFLGQYNADEVYAYSTNYDRTKTSLQLALAGLYPPTNETSWSKNIKWFPIPTYYTEGNDFLHLRLFGPCTNNGKDIEDIENLPEFKARFDKYQKFLAHMKAETGFEKKIRPFTMFELYACVRASMGMELGYPKWLSKSDFHKLEDIASLSLDTLAYTNKMKRILAGPIIERLLENVEKSNNRSSDKKIYLYATHDTVVGPLTRALNFTRIPALPEFGTAVILEKLRASDNQTYIKMKLWTGVTEELLPLEISDCGYQCPLKNFMEIVKPLLPTDVEKKCLSLNTFSKQ